MMSINFSGQWGQKRYEVKFAHMFKEDIQLPFLTRKAGKVPSEPSAFQFFYQEKQLNALGICKNVSRIMLTSGPEF